MTDPVELAKPVPELLRGAEVPFTDRRVTITAAELVPGDEGVTVRITYETDGESANQFDFEVDESWEFGTTQDVIDQLHIDLVEHIDTVSEPRER